MIFKTAKSDITFRLIYGASYSLLLAVIIVPFIIKRDYLMLITLIAICFPILFLFILLKRINIIIEDNFLTVKISGIKVYSVGIENITKIKKGETLWVGMHKYGTKTGGLIISAKYKDDLYITPENETDFLAGILEINPAIKFENKIN